MRHLCVILGVTVIGASELRTGVQAPAAKPLVKAYPGAMITAPPTDLRLDPFYKKYTDAFGIPIVLKEVYPGDHVPADIYHGKNLRPSL